MPRVIFMIPTKPVRGLEALSYLKRGLEPPILFHYPRPVTLGFAKWVSTDRRWFHKLYAILQGYFWIPCPKCHRPFGGHEISSVMPSNSYQGYLVCTYCTLEIEHANK